jgi:hypothetical protein
MKLPKTRYAKSMRTVRVQKYLPCKGIVRI